MRQKALFYLAIMVFLFLTSCKKEIQNDQVRQEAESFFKAHNGSTYGLNCEKRIDGMEILNKLSRIDKVELSVRFDIARTCERITGGNIINMFGAAADEMAGRVPGKTFSQECLTMSFEVFDEGFKLQNIEPNQDCPESMLFKANKRNKLENLLKETALAACTCKHENCEKQMITDTCSVGEEADINGDGLNEILSSDTCAGNGYVCMGYLWSIVNEQPRKILDDTIDFKDVAKRTDGRYPDVETSELDGTDTIFYLYKFDYRRGAYQSVNRQRREKKREITFSGEPIGTGIYVDGNFIGRLTSANIKERPTEGIFEAKGLPDKIIQLEFRYPGYKTDSYEWDWYGLPRCYRGGYYGFNLEKE